MLPSIFQKIIKRYKNNPSRIKDITQYFESDNNFNKLYPPYIQNLARRHWTPLAVAEAAAVFLAEKDGTKILDIGSGAGKFCISAAHYKPNAFYYGIEQRKNLVEQAELVKNRLRLNNVSFMHGNFTKIDLRNYDHFYFYNAFYENLVKDEKIDESIDYSSEMFHYYTNHFIKQLKQMPAGTKLATYHSMDSEVPAGFTLVGTEIGGLVKFWIKN